MKHNQTLQLAAKTAENKRNRVDDMYAPCVCSMETNIKIGDMKERDTEIRDVHLKSICIYSGSMVNCTLC